MYINNVLNYAYKSYYIIRNLLGYYYMIYLKNKAPYYSATVK